MLEQYLKDARQELHALQDDLSGFTQLVTEAEEALSALQGTQDLSALSEAKGRANVARELLEQQRAEITTAQKVLAGLERERVREEWLERLAAHASEADKHRAGAERAIREAARALEQALTTVASEWQAYMLAKEKFVAVGGEQFGDVGWVWNLGPLERQKLISDTLNALDKRGLDLAPVLDTEGWRCRRDRALPSKGLAPVILKIAAAHPATPFELKRRVAGPSGRTSFSEDLF